MFPTTEAAPEQCVNTAGSLAPTDVTGRNLSSMIPIPLRLPLDRTQRAHCGTPSPHARRCNRRPGHAGRHAFYWRHTDGRVREVWT